MNLFLRDPILLLIAILVAGDPCGVAMNVSGENEKATTSVSLPYNEFAEEVGIRSSIQRVCLRTNLSALPIYKTSTILNNFLFETTSLLQGTLRTPFFMLQTQFRNTSTILRI
jgi:hypothetical protein